MKLRAFLAVLALTANLPAEVTLSPYFQDNAVLQRGKPVPVWGRAESGEKVMVEFKGQKKETTADAQGRWRVDLDTLTASAEPAEMTVTGKNTLRIGNLLVGEVWLCSGQSNMAWTVKNSKDPEQEASAANYPLIRHFKAALTAAATPQDTVKGSWAVCSPETAGDFSAVAYYFGRELFRELNVPIGLLNVSYGGTPVESWMSEATLMANAVYPAIQERLKVDAARYPGRLKLYETRMTAWKAKKEEAEKAGKKFSERAPIPPSGPGVVDRFTLSSLHNAMLHPFIPAALCGVIWFQAEANLYRSAEYARLFPEMIKEWRSEFGQGDLPFYFVQVANQARDADTTKVLFPFLREAQMAGLALPGTGMAVTSDIGEAYNSHFKNKQEVGRRLALIALANTYDRPREFSGPRVKEITKTKDGYAIAFNHADGLKLTGEGGFELAGADQTFRPATAKIENNMVIVASPDVPDPFAVRYAWYNNPPMTLHNGAGLPAPNFRSDNWPVPMPAGGTSENAE